MVFLNVHRLFFDSLTCCCVEQQNAFKDHKYPPHCRVISRFLLLVPDMLLIIFEGASDSHLSK
jgi:hypothetical protein